MREKFNPSDEKYKKVEDLPAEHRDEFENVEGGGFIRKEAADLVMSAIKLSAFFKDGKTGMDILRGSAEEDNRQHDVQTKEGLLKVIESGYLRCIEEAPEELKQNEEVISVYKDKLMEKLKEYTDMDDEQRYKGGRNLYIDFLQKAFFHAPTKIKSDKEVVLLADKAGIVSALNFVDSDLKSDKEFWLEVVHNGGSMLIESASEELKRDREFILTAVQNNGYNLRYASAELRADKEIVCEAIRRGDSSCLYNADQGLKSDREFVLYVIEHINGDVLPYMDKNLLNDKEIILKSIRYTPNNDDKKELDHVLDNVSADLLSDSDIIKAIHDKFVKGDFWIGDYVLYKIEYRLKEKFK